VTNVYIVHYVKGVNFLHTYIHRTHTNEAASLTPYGLPAGKHVGRSIHVNKSGKVHIVLHIDRFALHVIKKLNLIFKV